MLQFTSENITNTLIDETESLQKILNIEPYKYNIKYIEILSEIRPNRKDIYNEDIKLIFTDKINEIAVFIDEIMSSFKYSDIDNEDDNKHHGIDDDMYDDKIQLNMEYFGYSNDYGTSISHQHKFIFFDFKSDKKIKKLIKKYKNIFKKLNHGKTNEY
jgi:hypothetical protein